MVLGILIALAPIVAKVLTFLTFREAIATKASRERLQVWLRLDHHDHLYRRYVGGALALIAKALRPGSVEETLPDRGMMTKFSYSSDFLAPIRSAARRAAASDFGWPIFDFALRLAVAYPTLSLLFIWGVTGQPGVIGEL